MMMMLGDKSEVIKAAVTISTGANIPVAERRWGSVDAVR
jgi:hypothetical protein